MREFIKNMKLDIFRQKFNLPSLSSIKNALIIDLEDDLFHNFLIEYQGLAGVVIEKEKLGRLLSISNQKKIPMVENPLHLRELFESSLQDSFYKFMYFWSLDHLLYDTEIHHWVTSRLDTWGALRRQAFSNQQRSHPYLLNEGISAWTITKKPEVDHSVPRMAP
eukprot:CAMPEP_0115003342 /NCGR_PEP_ID=MMETSP0216-20121206/18557_1 /TAXON_ID=223996 /ORGANISM="Protocruzia adherens, Strain Boccale" /LENGTH=163 /DNA_ID=CAMNT_0002369135 /DNA_START=283 /DNA_END=770 /DNA_ORIENTATION=+